VVNSIKRVTISNEGVFVNNVNILPFAEGDFVTRRLKELYHHLQLDYPKFFKMDNLSKLGILAAEILLEGVENKKELAIILSTSSSSLETDTAFQQTINDEDNFFPSPAVFVYTLPNIVIGEICIRHQIYAENMMFIINENNINDFYQQTKQLIETMKLKRGIFGYLDCYLGQGKIELFLFETN